MPLPEIRPAEALEAPLSRLMRVFRRVYFDQARAHQLTQTQALALSHLAKSGPRRAGDLAVWLEVTGGAATALAASLVERGLLERHPDPQDGRAVLLALTPEGHALIASLKAQLGKLLGQGMGDLPLPTQYMVLGGLEALADALEGRFPLGSFCGDPPEGAAQA